jgi:hypothetical protein
MSTPIGAFRRNAAHSASSSPPVCTQRLNAEAPSS